jgi:hypothetical protein
MGSCHDYGCHTGTFSKQLCQCNRECKGNGTCCADYRSHCETIPPPPPTPAPTTRTTTTTTEERCADVGCGASYDPDRNCQCHLACVSEKNCCHDYSTECVGPTAEDAPLDSDAPLTVDSCEAVGCGELGPPNSCNCHRQCGMNCCADYITLCVESGGVLAETKAVA